MINTFTKYKNRPIRFVEIYHVTGWKVKIYSISVHHEFVTETNLMDAKNKLKEWLAIASKHDLPTYKIATLILQH
ncbi:MAG: hypothetical protein IPK35_10180 [Saprospiraceae bacterium]|nr:hypothetical protein [Saprospiraceae bacterium]